MSTVSPIYIKTGVAAVAAALLDRFVCGQSDMTQNAYFGLSTGVGVGVGSYIATLTPAMLPDDPSGMYTGKGVMERGFEVLGGGAASFIVSKYLTKSSNNCSMTTKVMVILASDFIAEYAKDYILSEKLAFLS